MYFVAIVILGVQLEKIRRHHFPKDTARKKLCIIIRRNKGLLFKVSRPTVVTLLLAHIRISQFLQIFFVLIHFYMVYK